MPVTGSREIVVATGNRGKLREIAVLLDGLGLTLRSQHEFGVTPVEETGTTFVENALLKARHAVAETGRAAIADDSGLAVAALGGRPGVHSARYAGVDASDRQNLEKLLRELEDIDNRAAFFHCAAVFVDSAAAREPLIAEASWHGVITREARGGRGFGYDPVFFVPDCGCTSAELPPARKNELSHRGQAFRRLAAMLADQPR